MMIKVEISVNERTILKFWMVSVNFKGEEREIKKEIRSHWQHTVA